MYDLVIRNGIVVDGAGTPRREADVAIQGRFIVEVGNVKAHGRREINANGLLVTPGWIDPHTHYDGQVTWDPYLTPSCWHGVTTLVMGNCGVGFAPVKPGSREHLIDIMAGVEDIPGSALSEGIRWQWESFPEYLDVLDAKPHVMDIAAQIGHSAVRCYVMGDRGAHNEAANESEIEAMAQIVRSALTAGAVGFSTSRTNAHKGADGRLVPGTFVTAAEILAMGGAIRAAGHGVFEFASDIVLEMPVETTEQDEFDWMSKLSTDNGVKIIFNMVQSHTCPEKWRSLVGMIDAARGAGADIIMQVGTRPVGMIMGWSSSYHWFRGRPTFEALAVLSVTERIGRLKDPRVRDLITSEPAPGPLFVGVPVDTRDMFRLQGADGRLNYEPDPETSVQAIADRMGVSADRIIYDIMMENDGEGYIYVAVLNYAYKNLDFLYELFEHPASMLGLSDGGAHCGVICDASMPTFLLSHWVRDRDRGRRLSLERAVAMQTSEPARIYGFRDRGRIAPGFKADINLIDFEHLQLESPKMMFDLPAGGRRLVQKARGYAATIVSGFVTFENGEATGVLPGKLIRGGR